MKTVTNNYKNELKKMGKELDNLITYNLNGQTITLNNELISNINYHYEGNILKSVMKQLDFETFNEIPKDTEVNYRFGIKVNNSYEYINYGTFIVKEVEKLEDTDTYKITCYDKMLYSMVDYEDMNLTYPITIKNYLQDICDKLGLTLKDDNFANQDNLIENELYLDSEGNSLGYTFRDVLDEIAQATGSTICINDNDELEVRYIDDAINETQEVEGTDLNLTDTEEARLRNVSLKGNTSQDGTPTPTTPINIDVVSGLQEVEIVGNNLFDGEIELGGINPSDGSLVSNNSRTRSKNFIKVEPNTRYSFRRSVGQNRWIIGYTKDKIGITDGNFASQGSALGNAGTGANLIQFTTSPTTQYIKWYDTSSTDLTEQIMLNKGNNVLPYEPYKGKTYDVNLGKNLLPNYGTTQTINGITFTQNDDGSITANGTSTDIARYYILTNTNRKSFSKGTYTLSGCPSGGSSNNYKLDITLNGYHDEVGNGRSFSVNEGDFLTEARILIYSGQTINNLTFKPQLEKGSTKTSYSPYFTPIELCKIGTYQDKIFKGKGTNLANIDDIKIGKQWNNADNSSRATILDIPIKKGQNYSLTSSWTNSHITQIRGAFFVSGYSSVAVPNSYPYYNEEKDYVSIEILADTTITSDMLNGVQIMLNEGNSTTYEPYNAKDKWLLHKEIGKVVLNGSESWSITNSGTPNWYYTSVISSINIINDSTINNSLCDHYIWGSVGNSNTNTGYFITKNSKQVRIRYGTEDTIANFKSWLANNNVMLYYVLANPTTEEITNSELVEQLNALDNAHTLDGITNITSTFPLSLTYVSDIEEIDEELIKNTRASFDKTFSPINSLVLSRSADSDNIYIQDEDSIEENGLHELKIADNQILNGNNRDEYINEIFDKVNGLTYSYNDYESIGITYLELCDRYRVSLRGNTYQCIMFNDEIEVNNGLNEIIYTDEAEESKTDYTKADKTDRRINQTTLIVDKQQGQINSLVEKVVDVSNKVDGTGSITLTNAHEGNLHYLSIKGNISRLYPANNVYPTNNLYPIGPTLLIDNVEYTLDIDRLRYVNNTLCDEFIYKDGECYIIRRLNSNNQALANEVIEERESIILQVNSSSTISLKHFNNAILSCEYLLENVYTDNFASQVDVKSEIIQTENSIAQKVSAVSDENGNVTSGSIILAINKDESQAVINADKISLEGKEINLTSEDITINSDNFKVDSEGRVEAKELTTGNNVYIGSQDDYGIKRIQFTDSMFINRYVSPTMEIMQLISPLAINIKASNNTLSVLSEQTGIIFGDTHVAIFRADGIRFAYQPVIDSDIRLKDNIKDTDISFIDDLKVKEYEYKTDHKKHIGLIAQDYINKDYSKYFLDKNEDGYYGIRYNDITNALIKYCQELKQKLDKQEEEIKLLKNKYCYADMVIMRNYLLGKIDLSETDIKQHYDLNGDGVVDSADLVLLRKILLKGDEE